jgi:arsenite methyltransferase
MKVMVDTKELEEKVQRMYRAVATEPHGEYHFELGRSLAERLGYPNEVLDQLPERAIESFAGVGYFFDLADLQPDERVVDLGSGSGMDVFFACTRVGSGGRVVGVDFTAEQLSKAQELAVVAGFEQAEFRSGRIERLPVEDESADCVISNGVINLSPEKDAVFAEAARVLRPGGRLALRTSSASSSSRSRSSATPTCGHLASAAPRRRTATGRRSRRPACASRTSGATRTSSSRSAPVTPA